MGGFGVLVAMYRTLKENAKLLPERITFSELSKKYKRNKAAKPLVFEDKMTAEERSVFRKKLKENKLTSMMQLGIALVVLAVLFFLAIYYIMAL